jgi:hypothetical protein
MMVESAFCTNCGAVVGEDWEFCESCGSRQPIGEPATGGIVEEGAQTSSSPSAPRPASATALAALEQGTPTATYLFVIGGAFILAGIIYLFATAGFPPGITTTYEYHADGSTSTSSSPDTVEVIITVALFVIGAVAMRASQAARPSGR